MKKKIWTGAALGLFMTAAAAGLFGMGAAETLNADRINIRRDVERYGKDVDNAWKDTEKAKLGTRENPFVILELVADEEPEKPYPGEAGFLVSGCEPENIERMIEKEQRDRLYAMDTPLFGFTNQIFAEEWNAEEYAGWEKKDAAEITLFGYYERVKAGTGSFAEGGGSFVKKEGGDWNWHTTETCNEEMEKAHQESRMNATKADTRTEIGSRVYARRTETAEYYESSTEYQYTHYDDFLISVIGLLDPVKRDAFCVYVKTITAEELNMIYEKDKVKETEDWIQAANFIYVYGNDEKSWDFAGDKDLSWASVMRIMKRVAHDASPAAFWGNAAILHVENTPVNTQVKANYHVFDWDGNYLDEANGGESSTGSNNNLYKLGLMLTRWDARLFYRFFLEDNPASELFGGKWVDDMGTIVTDSAHGGEYVNETEKSYWSEVSFKPDSKKMTKDEIERAWKNYHLDLEKGSEITTHYVHKNVFFYYTGSKVTGAGENKGLLSGIFTNNIDFDNANKDKYVEDMFIHLGADKNITNSFLGLKYVLDTTMKADFKKSKLRVLDLEPGRGSGNMTAAKIGAIIRNAGIMIDDIEVVHQTTAEFVGRTEDLCENYDMIYLGLLDEAYNTEPKYDTEGNLISRDTVYNEEKLNKKIYLHVGDEVKQRGKSDSITDMVPELYKWLMEFIFEWTGSTALAELYWQDIYEVDWLTDTAGNKVTTVRMPGNDITEKKKDELEKYRKMGYPVILSEGFREDRVDTLVDKASHIYDFVTREQAENTFLESELDGDSEDDIENIQQLKECLERFNLGIKLNEKPAEYSEDTAHEGNYIKLNADGKYELIFEYELTGAIRGKKYNVSLYLDRNRDGRYTEAELDTRNMVYPEQSTLTLSTRLGQEWFGAIPWKLVAEAAEAEDGRKSKASVTGICAAEKAKDQEKEKIKVLQINQNKNQGSINLSTEEVLAGDTVNEQFRSLIRDLEDYEITVDVYSIEEIDEKFKTGDIADLDEYAMLIFGFADGYGNIPKENTGGKITFFDWLKEYIEEGKSVLFTHDTTSFQNTKLSGMEENDPHLKGYNINQYLRGSLGMDRFDVLHQLHGKETDPAKRVESAGKTDKAWSLDDKEHQSEKEYPQKQGYTCYAVKRIASTFYHRPGLLEITSAILNGTMDQLFQKLTYKGLTIGNAPFETNQISRINEGQITRYPYYIEDNFEVGPTHGQYYQLNMEDDEIVVWYTMEAGTGDYEKSGELYGLSPKDTSNNYYIYNKANVTYSGIGHSKTPTEMELKLLVNTIIAAYKHVEEPPYVDFPDGNCIDTESNPVEWEGYLNFDYEELAADYSKWSEEERESRIEFIPMAKGGAEGELLAGVYPVEAGVTQPELPEPEDADKVLYQVYDRNGKALTDENKGKTKDGRTVWKLKNGEPYYITYDRSLYNKDAKPRFLFSIESTSGRTGENAVLTLNRRELFNLD